MALAQPDSDIAALWDEALTVYEGVTKINLRTQSTKQRTVESIKVGPQLDRHHGIFKNFLLIDAFANLCSYRKTRSVSSNNSPHLDTTKENLIGSEP